MLYDVAVVGAGLSGLTAASLLAKCGMKVIVIEKGNAPGGSCGIFKREGAIFDQGSAMLYGFGEQGFNAHRLLQRYFHDPNIFNFFDKLTSTYCYATVEESPAILAAVMFVDNHIGGSYYPVGSTLFLPGKLEKVIEEHDGEMLYGHEAIKMQFADGKPTGILTDKGVLIEAKEIVYSGTVWNLYGKMIDGKHTTKKRLDWAIAQKPTYPSVVLFALIDKEAIPEGTAAVEMLVGNPDRIDESEVTAYIPSIDDHSLCAANQHVIEAIGPTFEPWFELDAKQYLEAKQKEQERLISVLARRFPGIEKHVQYAEVATPKTIERYCHKNKGAVAGPKQMLGQHMFKRLHTRTEWDNLYCCGESTVMGTGTPTVTTSGISVANAILKKHRLKPFVYKADRENYVHVRQPPVINGEVFSEVSETTRKIMQIASACQFCEKPQCVAGKTLDIPSIMRRAAVGNIIGARKLIGDFSNENLLHAGEARCVEKARIGQSVQIVEVIKHLMETEE